MSDYKVVPLEPTPEMMANGGIEMGARDEDARTVWKAMLAAAPAVQGGLMLNGFRVMHLTGRSGAREGERWEIYAPCGSGGVVREDEVADWVVRKLLDSLATSNLEDQREPVGFIRHVHYHGIARNSEECEVVLYDNAKNLPEGTLLYTAPQPTEHRPCPEDIREGAPYDDPAFSALCREHEIWGTAAAALCAVFWEAGKRVVEQQPAPDHARLRERFDEIEREICEGKHTASSVFTQMRTAALYTAPQPAEQQPKCSTCRDVGIVGHSNICPECVETWAAPEKQPSRAAAEQQPAPDVACSQSRESSMVVLEQGPDGTPTVWCDPEIADLVSALNKAGIRTVASCSGHGHRPGNIMLADGRELVIARDFDEARKIDAMFPGINGEPPMVDVKALVEALEACRDELMWMIERHNQQDQNDGSWLYDYQTVEEADAALAANRKGLISSQQPASDVAGQVEALTMARETIASALRANAPDYFTTDADIAQHVVIQRIDAALAAHRKQGDKT